MRQNADTLVVLAASLLLGGCAPILYDVHVDAFDRMPVPAGARISVVAASLVDPMLGDEVRGRIERLVAHDGFQVVHPASSADTVDFVVLAAFGAGPPAAAYANASGSLQSLLRTMPPNLAPQTRWLIVAVARPSDLGKRTDAGGSTTGAGEVPWVWYATTFSTGAGGHLDTVIDYLLVPTFEWFGRTTGSRIATKIGQYDPRVRVLINPPD